jgi:hypothetical protein
MRVLTWLRIAGLFVIPSLPAMPGHKTSWTRPCCTLPNPWWGPRGLCPTLWTQGDAEAQLLFSQTNGQCVVMLVFAPYVPKDASAL